MHLFSTILQLILLEYLPFSLAAGPKALSDIFEVDTRSASTYPGSCLRLEDPSKPDSLPLYDQYAAAGSIDNLLNNMYVQIYYSVVNTLLNIESKSYNKESEVAQRVRRLVGSLIGVTPRNRGDDEAEFEPAAGSLDSRKLEEIRGQSSTPFLRVEMLTSCQGFIATSKQLLRRRKRMGKESQSCKGCPA